MRRAALYLYSDNRRLLKATIMRQRTRVTDPVYTTQSMSYHYPYDNSERKSSVTSEVLTSTKTETMSDIPTVGFDRLRSRGIIINSPMFSQKGDSTQTLEFFENFLGVSKDAQGKVDKKSGFIDRGTMSAKELLGNAKFPSLPSSFGSNAKDIAVTQAWANVNQATASSLVSIAEARKTASSMTQIMARAIKILRAVRKLDAKALKGELSPSELSDRYLEARYAIRPLIYDAQGLIDAYNHKRKADRFTARGTARDHFSDSINGTVTNFSSFRTNYRSQIEASFEARAGVLYQYDLKGLSETLSVYGFDQPIEAIWELVPFSFIIDWFFNVGNTIAAWTPNVGTQPLASWVKTTTTIKKTCAVTSLDVIPDVYPQQDSRGRSVSGSGSWTTVSVDTARTPDPRRPFLPRLDINLDALKLVDLLLIGNKLR